MVNRWAAIRNIVYPYIQERNPPNLAPALQIRGAVGVFVRGNCALHNLTVWIAKYVISDIDMRKDVPAH